MLEHIQTWSGRLLDDRIKHEISIEVVSVLDVYVIYLARQMYKDTEQHIHRRKKSCMPRTKKQEFSKKKEREVRISSEDTLHDITCIYSSLKHQIMRMCTG